MNCGLWYDICSSHVSPLCIGKERNKHSTEIVMSGSVSILTDPVSIKHMTKRCSWMNIIYIIPHSHAQRIIPMVILNLIKLKVSTNHHTVFISHPGALADWTQAPWLCWIADYEWLHSSHFFAETDIRFQGRPGRQYRSPLGSLILMHIRAFQRSCV